VIENKEDIGALGLGC